VLYKDNEIIGAFTEIQDFLDDVCKLIKKHKKEKGLFKMLEVESGVVTEENSITDLEIFFAEMNCDYEEENYDDVEKLQETEKMPKEKEEKMSKEFEKSQETEKESEKEIETVFYRVRHCDNDNTDFLAQSLDELRKYLSTEGESFMGPDGFKSLEDAVEKCVLENNIYM
jgi:hypothetical protein